MSVTRSERNRQDSDYEKVVYVPLQVVCKQLSILFPAILCTPHGPRTIPGMLRVAIGNPKF